MQELTDVLCRMVTTSNYLRGNLQLFPYMELIPKLNDNLHNNTNTLIQQFILVINSLEREAKRGTSWEPLVVRVLSPLENILKAIWLEKFIMRQ